MQECFKLRFMNLMCLLKSKNIQMIESRFYHTVGRYSIYFIDQDNIFTIDNDKLKTQTDVIVVDKYLETTKDKENIYIIISFSNTIVIVEQNNINLVQQIFVCNNKSVVFFISNSKKYFNLQVRESFSEEDIVINHLQKEIRNFLIKFNIIITDLSKSIYYIWNIISPSIAGYLIRKAYSKKYDRITTFFESTNEKQEKESNASDFIYLRDIKHGSSGYVTLMYHIETEQLFASKSFFSPKCSKSQDREVYNYETISHPLIPKLFCTIHNKGYKSIVMEYIDGIELQNLDFLERKDKLRIIFEIMIIIEYLHNNHLIYRDLKPNNIIIDDNKIAILIDFDKMIKVEDGIDNPDFSRDFSSYYHAPEFSEGKASYSSDIYSIGILIYFILTIELRNKNKKKIVYDFKEFQNIPEEYNECIEICKKCTNKNPQNRPTISELIDEFYIRFYSSIEDPNPYIKNFRCSGIHEAKYYKFWLSLAENENFYSQLYRNSIDFYFRKIPEMERKAKKNSTSPLSTNNFTFDILPDHFNANKKQIKNKVIQRIYSEFSFLYFDISIQNKKDQNFDLFDFLKDFKFITIQLLKNNDFFYTIVCVELKCIIIKNVKVMEIDEILKKIEENGSSVINVSSLNDSKKLIEVKEEINNFVNNFKDEITKNEFVSMTISPIICFLIRRYFYPTEYFQNPEFFIFDKRNNKEYEKREYIIKNFNNYIVNKEEETHYKYNLMKYEIIDELQNSKENKIRGFTENDFVILRTIFSNGNVIYNLVLHLDSLYVFMMKKYANYHLKTDEINTEFHINQNFAHRIQIPFYGILKYNEKTIGFIYEYMSNGNLESFISSKKMDINPIYYLITFARLFEFTEYFTQIPHIHFDISLLNIFVNHDDIVYISNAAFLSSNENHRLSTILNFNSFGKIIRYLYHQCINDCFNNNSFIKEIDNLQNDYEYKNECESNDISILYKIKNALIKDMKLFNFTEDILINNKSSILITYIAQFFYENVCILFDNEKEIDKIVGDISIFSILLNRKNDKDKSCFYNILGSFYYDYIENVQYILKAIEYFEKSTKFDNSEAYLFLGRIYFKRKDYLTSIKYFKISANLNNQFALYNLGSIYINGYGVDKNYIKARKYYELSAKHNNSNAFCSLGNLYYKGLGVEKDYSRAKSYYEISAKLCDPLAFNGLGLFYQNGYDTKKDYVKALDYYQLSAKFNESVSLNNLGNLFYNGFGVKKDYVKAKKYFELSAKQNDKTAFFNLGIVYLYGKGVKQDYLKAKNYFELSAKQNDPNAFLSLGCLYYNGLGVKKSYLKAKEYFELSAKQEDPDALYFLGYLYDHGEGVEQNFLKAKEYYELSAPLNNVSAIHNLGVLYSNGYGVKQDYSRAKECFEIASSFNNSKSLYNLGIFYLNGFGVEKNFLKAKEYFELSAGQNNSDALYMIGKFYYDGNWFEKNFNQAKEYFELSSSLNNSNAMLALGILYLNGYGVKQNFSKAKEYFELSLSLNNSNAIFALGFLYLNGLGVEQSYLEAIKFFELSAQLNNSDALYFLGRLYIEGKGVKRDYNIAKRYFELSSHLGDSDAINNIGILYINGQGVEKDFSLGKEYLELAANLGNSEALRNLGLLYENGHGLKKDFIKAKEYFEQAARLNNPEALNNLGCFYCNDQTIQKSYLKAKKYFELAAKLKNGNSLCNLGLLYFFGNGVEKNFLKAKECFETAGQLKNSEAYLKLGIIYYFNKKYSKAKDYFELSAQLNNSEALLKLGYIFLYGEGVPKDYLKAKKYFKLSAQLNNSEALFGLGYFHSNGEFFDVDISKAIIYLMKCREIHYGNTPFYNSVLNVSDITKYNYLYYRSCNDLGLIYITAFEDNEKAFELIKEAGFGEFPFAQNNLGLFYELYFNNIGNAEYMYKRSLKNCFALAAFNLGRIKEKENGLNKESIEYYFKASEYQDSPLTFYNKNNIDQRLNISKAFILCLTYLKLAKYFYEEKKLEEFKKYFIKSLSKLINSTNYLQYKFQIYYKNHLIQPKNKFSDLKSFILNFPLFRLINQPYLKPEVKRKLQDVSKNNINERSIIEHKFNSKINKKDNLKITKLNKEENSIKIKNDISSESKQNNENDKYVNTLNLVDETYKTFNELKNPKFKNESVIIFEDPNELINFVLKKEDITKEFIREIDEIIEVMNDIIFTPPYLILFGRIYIKELKKKKRKYMKNINQLFYEGAEINELQV